MEGLEFNVSTLLQQVVGESADYEVAVDEALDLDGIIARLITGPVRLTRTNFGILAHATLDARLGLECDRCLDPYEARVKVDFSEEYLPVIDVSTGRPVQSERADETFLISPNHIVDLTEATRQHILLSVPMHRLCREDCQGLCPTCGVNRNTRSCSCVEETESPLSALAVLLEESKP